MALKFHSKKGTPGKGSPAAKASAGTAARPSWLKRGKAGAALGKRDEERHERRREESDRLFRFRLEVGKTADITFLDGDLITEGDEAGMLDIPYFEEHEVWGFAGKGPSFFLCTRETEECPLCEAGNNAYYAGALTIIDHRGFKRQSGKEEEYSRKILVAKALTLKKLAMLANKRDGLTCWTCEVSRSSDKVARVGDMFDFEPERHTIEQLVEGCLDAKPTEPTDYEAELPYRDAAELIGMGLGKKPEGQAAGGHSQAAPQSGESDDIPF